MTLHHLSILAHYAMRYAMGRRSSAPSDVAASIIAMWHGITPNTRRMMVRDLRERLEDHDTGRLPIGDDCDRQTWGDLLRWMGEQS